MTIETVQGTQSMQHTTLPKGAGFMLLELQLDLKALYCSNILLMSQILILLRTVWKETRRVQRQSSVKFGFGSLVHYNLDFVPCTVPQSHTACYYEGTEARVIGLS